MFSISISKMYRSQDKVSSENGKIIKHVLF